MNRLTIALMSAAMLLAVTPAFAEERSEAAEPLADFPDSLVTESPKEGFALAIKLARLGVKATQPDIEVLKRLRPVYAEDPDSLIAASQVIAIHYETIAAANDYWEGSD